MVRRLNRSGLYTTELINSSNYFYETNYNISRQLVVTAIYHGEFHQLQRHIIQKIQPQSNLWRTHLWNVLEASKLKRQTQNYCTQISKEGLMAILA